MSFSSRVLAVTSGLILVMVCTACSGTSHKSSNDPASRISGANSSIRGYNAESELEYRACRKYGSLSKREFTCKRNLHLKYEAGLVRAMGTYSQVAKGTDGKCQAALIRVAHTIQVNLNFDKGTTIHYPNTKRGGPQYAADSMLVDMLYPGVIAKAVHAVGPACGFK